MDELDVKFQPMHDRVLCRMLPRPTKSKGGIILVEQRGRYDRAMVVRCGPDTKEVKADERVIFNPYGVLLVIGRDGLVTTKSAMPGDDEFFVIREDELLAVEDPPPPEPES